MSHPQFIGIVGHKKSGKTTLVEQLVKELVTRGKIIGTIKMTTHDLEFDTPGKDTFRHRAAGAGITLIKSKSRAALFSDSNYFSDELISVLFDKCDFVFIEGDSGSPNPKIYVADEREPRNDISGEIIAVWGTPKESLGAPHFDKNQIDKLCGFLISPKNRR